MMMMFADKLHWCGSLCHILSCRARCIIQQGRQLVEHVSRSLFKFHMDVSHPYSASKVRALESSFP